MIRECVLGGAVITLLLLLLLPAAAPAQSDPVRLTFDQGTDGDPIWDPAGNTIAYAHTVPLGQDLYSVQADGSGEGPMAMLPTGQFGISFIMSWVGMTGQIALEERIDTFEYMFFNPAAGVPFVRTVTDGDDAAFTRKLVVGPPGRGELIKISRDGKTVLIRSTESGSTGRTTIRTGKVSAMNGGSAFTFGKAQIDENFSAGEFFFSAALSPDGSFFVIPISISDGALPKDLWLYTVDNSRKPVNLTKNAADGFINFTPDISPDGKKVIFAGRLNVVGETADIYQINVDGTGLERLTNTPRFSEFSPTSSPDGTQIAFAGIHAAGFESAFPPLEPGESPNTNIYRMTIRQDPIVGPDTVITDPPIVSVADRTVVLTFKTFSGVTDLRKLTASRRSFESRATRPGTRAKKRKAKIKLSFQYQATVTQIADGNGNPVNKVRKSLTKRSSLTLKKLPPGSYTASYSVVIFRKKGTAQPRRAGVTAPSPAASFDIAP